MSEYKSKIALGAVLAILVAIGLAGATIALGPQTTSSVSLHSQQSSSNNNTSQQASSTSSAVLGQQSVLIVQLTDPPIVPVGTTSLNLTYTAIQLLVAEPVSTTTTSTTTTSSTTSTSSSSTSSTTTTGSTSSTTSTSNSKSTSQGSQLNLQTITVTPTGGSATVNLLKLQNISQTLAASNLPNGSEIYSVTFVVSSINVDINGVISPVILASGGTSLLVALTSPAQVQGTMAVLLDLNPTIINTPTGYQMIPSSIGIVRASTEIGPQDQQIGYTHQLSHQDQNDINHARGNLTAKLVSLSVSGNKSTISIQVSNAGNASTRLVLIGLGGNFTDPNCVATSTTTTQNSHDHSGHSDQQHCQSQNQLVFAPSVPSTSTSTTSRTITTTSTTSSSSSTGCISGQLALVNSGDGGNGQNYLLIAPGQCVTLTFSGIISDGHSGNIFVPSTLSGQTYTIHLISSSDYQGMINCTEPFSQSCVANTSHGNQDGQGNHD